MKKVLLGCAAALMLLGSATYAADLRDVTVVNGKGYGIKFFGFNNPGDNDWSDNELGGTMGDGASVYDRASDTTTALTK